MKRAVQLAITNPHDLIFEHAPQPAITRRRLALGAGKVHLEFNLTVPPMESNATGAFAGG